MSPSNGPIHAVSNARRSRRTRNLGFSVIELMIGLAVAAIILGYAVPSFQVFIANNQVATAGRSIVEGLNLARFTAISSGDEVAICASLDESNCSSGDWDHGWIVFDNADGNSSPSDTETIRVATHTDKLDASSSTAIIFQRDGTITANTQQSITVCYADTGVTDQCRQITVSPFGVISSTKTTAPASTPG